MQLVYVVLASELIKEGRERMEGIQKAARWRRNGNSPEEFEKEAEERTAKIDGWKAEQAAHLPQHMYRRARQTS